MRFHLWQRLFLAFAALSVLALAGFAGWQQQSFRRGFLGYLDEVALERLQPATTRLAAAYRQNGGWQFLQDNPRAFRELIDPRGEARDEARREAMRPRDERAPPNDRGPREDRPPADDRPSDRPSEEHGARADGPPPRPGDDAGPRDGEGPPRGPPRPHGPPDLMPGLLLLDAADAVVVGNPDVPASAHQIPVEVDGARVGTLRLMRLPAISSSIDVGFAREQTRTALVAGIAVLIGAVLLAFALARWLLAPVRALAEGTRVLATGDYSRRIAVQRSDEFGALADDFNHLAASLEQHRDARRQWGADIAHELRTPLSVLRGEIQALQDGVRVPNAKAFDSLYAECERLGSLIEDLYQLALADAGALEYRFETIDLGEIAQEAVDLQQHACAESGITIESHAHLGVPVRGDARRLAQLIDNLLANARRYTDAPGRIRVELSAHGSEAQLVIEDTPPGVPADDLPRLFDRLYRVERSRTRAAGGAGLGLAICRAIVDAHGGRIGVAPSSLGGLRVTVHLPAANGDAA